MADINNFIPILKEWEGSFSDNPRDSGGPTMFGVTLKTFQDTFGGDKTVDDLKNITDAQLAQVIESYWDKADANEINDQQVANAFVDWIYNAGPYHPICAVQTLVGVQQPTGFCGSVTVGRINDSDAPTLCNMICDARVKFYNDLVVQQPKNEVFLAGWLRRANSLRYKPNA